MAHRRMFSPEIVESEEFLSLSVTSQALYFHLAMNADDDGFIQPRLVMRSVGSTEDDLKLLLTKRFLLPCEGGVVVIKHWLIHNMIRADRYKPTRFEEQKNALFIKENKAYTDRDPILGLQNGNHLAPQVRLGKDSIGNITSAKAEDNIEEDVTIEEDEDMKRYQGFKRKPEDKNARLIMLKVGQKFPNPLKQMKSIATMLKSGFTDVQILEKFEELKSDPFWGQKGVDFGIVLAEIGKMKNTKPTFKSYV